MENSTFLVHLTVEDLTRIIRETTAQILLESQQSSNTITQEVLSIVDTHKYLAQHGIKISQRTVYNLIKDNQIKATYYQHKWFVKKEYLDGWIQDKFAE